MSVQDYLNDLGLDAAKNLFNRALRHPDPKCPRRWAAVEALESRVLLSASITINAANQVAFLGDPGNDDVTVAFASDASGGMYTISDSTTTIDVVANNGSAVTTAGSGTNTVTVTNLSSLGTASLSFDGNGNGGTAPGDIFNIQSSDNPIFINQTGTAAAHDTFNLGNTTDGVQSILAPVSLQDASGAADVTIDDSADANNQAFTLAGGSSVSTISDLPPGIISYANGEISSLTINGGSGNDDLTVDFSAGNPIPALSAPGLIYSAGGGSDNVLNLVGTPPSGKFASVVPKATGAGSGSITFVDQANISTELTYADLTPINDVASSADYTFNDFGYPDQSFSATDGPMISEDQTIQFASTPTPSSPVNFETTDIANKSFVTFNTPPETPGVAGPGVNATINLPTASSGLLSLTINTPTGGDNDISFINTPAGVVTSFNNSGATSITNVTGLGVANGTVLFLDGGPGTNTLNYDAGGENATVSPGLLSGEVLITIPGAGVVDAIDYTQINITDVAPLTITPGAAVSIGGVEGVPIANALAGTFTAPVSVLPPAGGFPASDFTASINWGDGSPIAAGAITEDFSDPGVYSITSTHAFAVNGTFTVTTTASFGGGSYTTPVNGTPVTVTLGAAGPTGGIDATAKIVAGSLTGSSGNTITGIEGSSTGTVLLGGFTDGDPSATVADFTSGGGSVVVNWGDGSAPQTMAASDLTFIGVAGAGEWTINAAHTYTEEGTYGYTATVTDSDGAATIVSGSAVVADAPLTAGSATLLTPNKGVALPGITVVATFTDANTFATTADYTDQIDWGDGSPESTGVIVATATPGVFDVEAAHTYTKLGGFTTLVTVHDDGGSQVMVEGSATVTLPTPVIVTNQLPASGTVLVTTLSDSVTVTGGNKPTGTVTFDLYNNAGASGTPLFTDTETLSGGTATSNGYVATAVGTDYWVVTYNGNARNNPVTSSAAAEPVVISPAVPAFSNLSSESIIIRSSSETFTGMIAAGSLIPPGNVTVTLNGVNKTVVIKSNGTFSATFSTGSLPVGEYTVSYNYAGSSDFLGAIDTSELDVTYGITPQFKNVKYKSGTTIPIAILLTDVNGTGVNTVATSVTTTGLARNSTPGTLIPSVDVGEVFTPDSDGDTFTLPLSTTGLKAGKYILYFTITGDPVMHSVTFRIKK